MESLRAMPAASARSVPGTILRLSDSAKVWPNPTKNRTTKRTIAAPPGSGRSWNRESKVWPRFSSRLMNRESKVWPRFSSRAPHEPKIEGVAPILAIQKIEGVAPILGAILGAILGQ